MGQKNKDFTDELAAMLPKERVERAKRDAEKEIFQIRLSELRKKVGLRQEDIKNFSQSSISKLESRKDIKEDLGDRPLKLYNFIKIRQRLRCIPIYILKISMPILSILFFLYFS